MITHSKQTRKKIKGTQIILQSTLESIKGVIILSIDKNYQYLNFNSVHKDVMLSAYNKDVQIGMDLLQCITNETDKVKAKINYDRALAGESHITIEEFGDKERYYYETRYNPIFNDIDEIIGATAFSSNVTDRIQMENALRESEERYKRIADGLTDYLYTVIVKDGNVVETIHNEACKVVTGFSSNEFASDPYLWINMVVPEEREFVSNRFLKILEGKDLPPFEHRIIHKNGEIRWISDTAIPKYDSNGVLVYYDGVIKDITERKQAEILLNEKEQSYKELIDLAPDAFFQGDIRGNFIVANDKAVSLTEYSKEELLSMNMKDLFYESILNNKPLRFDLLEKGEIVTNEREITTKTGICIMVEMNSRKMPNGTYQSFIRDISERRRAEEELINTKILLDATFQQSPVPMVLVSMPDAILRIINSACLEFLGIQDEPSLVNTSLFDLHPSWEDYDINGNPGTLETLPLASALKGESTFNVERRIVRKDGSIRWELVSGAPIYNLKGEVAAGYLIMNDITLRKNSEEILRWNEDLFSKIFRANPIALTITCMPDGKFTDVNDEWCRLFGFSKEDVVGHNATEFNIIDNETRILLSNEFISTGRLWLVEHDVVTNNGEKKSVLSSAEVISIKGEQFSINTTIDVTERKQADLLLQEKNEEIEAQSEEAQQINEELIKANEELIQSKERAEQSDRLKTAFLQNMSHEIRTPMNAIMGFSEMLVSQYNNKEKLEQYSGIINQRCNDLLDIINDILDIAKIESGQLPVYMEECNLNALFGELVLFFKEQQKRLDKQQIKFNLQVLCDPSDSIIVTDKVKLKQIFINLIGNAFKFTDNGNIDGGCRLDKNNNLLFFVSDTGIGIAADKQNLIFERFAQVDHGSNRLYGGTGLGLSIVDGLVRLLGGEIFLESEPGKGSTFSFSISYKTTQPQYQELLVFEEPKEFQFTNKTILIVEDDYYNAEYLKEILAQTGLNILHAIYGKDAVEISLTQPVDLVLMDIRLPDIDGYEATRQIKKQKPNLKIIAQTAYASNIDKQIALDAGCNDYVSKPTKREVLLAIIGKQLGNLKI